MEELHNTWAYYTCRAREFGAAPIVRQNRATGRVQEIVYIRNGHMRNGRNRNLDMKLLSAIRAGCAVCAVLVLVASCTTSSADGPTSSSASAATSASVVDPNTRLSKASPASPTPSVIEPPTPTLISLDKTAQEAADRAAIEAQWAAFWKVYIGIVRTPQNQRSAALDAVSVDPSKGRVLDAASRLEEDGLDYYGDVALHTYSIDLDADGSQAVLMDCQDQSQYGSIYVATGKKRTVGVDHNHTQARFVLGDDGVWRVQNVQYIENVPC